ncbi:DUF7010 family protein [Lysinibacillus sp. RS11]|uniref:DUF7010 family protein n=1 Tax=Lysinibacillus sp. RS11 TaxID=3242682 RepID=UPI0035C6B466
MEINTSREDIALRGKRGLHFILASIIIWCSIFIIWLLPINDIATRNFLTFCFTAVLLPLAFFFKMDLSYVSKNMGFAEVSNVRKVEAEYSLIYNPKYKNCALSF